MSDKPATRTCHWCHNEVPRKEYCPTCMAAWPNRPAPETMTADEREAEVLSLAYYEVDLDLQHARLQQLLGRPVWTHEIVGIESLAREARWESRPATFAEVVGKLPAEKVIVVGVPADD